MTTATAEPSRSGYADVNGLHMYYEEYGDGSPLILLHGGMLTIELNFAGFIPALSQRHRVIGVEMQGHGRTADIDRPITPAALASDVVGLLDMLEIDRAHVFGHSMGGAVTLELGVSYPDRVRSLVAASVSVRRDGLHEDLTDPAKQATSTRMPTQQDFARLPRGLPKALAASGALHRVPRHAVRVERGHRGLVGRTACRHNRTRSDRARRPRLHHRRARSADAGA